MILSEYYFLFMSMYLKMREEEKKRRTEEQKNRIEGEKNKITF